MKYNVCVICDYRGKPKVDPQTNLSLPVTGPLSGNLVFHLRKYFHAENIEWFCPKCGKNVNALSATRIGKAPKVLAIDLKRYYANSNAKCRSFIEVERELNMSDHLDKPDEALSPIYRLRAVITHKGEKSDSGHYTTTFLEDDWSVEVDDHKQELVTDTQFLHTDVCYIMVYENLSVYNKVLLKEVTK